MSRALHVYADDGFESAHRSERAARTAAKRGSTRRPGVRYDVVACSAHDYTGGGHGTAVASYRNGKETAGEDSREAGVG